MRRVCPPSPLRKPGRKAGSGQWFGALMDPAQWEGKKGGLVLFIKILNQETLLVFLFIAPPKLVLYLVKCTSIKIGLKSSS